MIVRLVRIATKNKIHDITVNNGRWRNLKDGFTAQESRSDAEATQVCYNEIRIQDVTTSWYPSYGWLTLRGGVDINTAAQEMIQLQPNLLESWKTEKPTEKHCQQRAS